MQSILVTLRKAIQLGNPIVMMKSLWRHRYLIEQMVRRDLSQRYRGSFLGFLWSIINPLFMLVIYTFIFSVIFKSRWQTTPDRPLQTGEFALILYAGLIPYNFFAEVIGRSPLIILAFPNYVKKVVFPLEILIVVAIGTSLITSLINLCILVVASILLLGHVSATILFIPLMYLPLILLLLGLGWFLSSWGVYVRDFGQVITIVLQVLFFMTPIFYSVSSVPDQFQFVMNINPLTMIITNFRNLLIWNDFFSLSQWFLWVGITGVLACLGYTWFMATKRGFADVL